MLTREQVVSAARAYVGTPFVHQGRIRGKALDCVGLVLCVFEDLGVMGASHSPESWTRLPEYTTYGPQPLRRVVFDKCVTRLIAKPRTAVKAGDVLSLRVPMEPCHVAIVSERAGVLYMIHAYNGGTEKCVEHVFDVKWQRRVAGVFSIPGVEE